MKMMNLILMSLVMIVSSGYCLADTLYLKNGSVIQSDTVWQDGGYFMYKKYGATVGVAESKVDRVEYSSQSKDIGSSFQFDVWPFGCTVHEAINIAENHDIPLHKFGIISMNKRFHPMVKNHSDATHFYYNTNLLGHFAKVDLFFTPASKKLHTVKVYWSNQKTKDSMLAREIVSMITEKYGNPHKGGKKLFYKTTKWIAPNANQIVMDVHSTSIYLNYLHTEFRKQDQYEIHNLKVKKLQVGSTKDENKF